ncbi:MAG: UvrD-helicase domain-containing protein [Clostridia bacterium]|nr:UvrD-helicase domain-containing protein [Clostridia bacterium]
MAERKWTDSQKAAINTRDRTLLVSAAAGSGKTATLTERIITSILDEKDPVNIEDMLIVTYTRAAVGELRERIGKAVKKAMSERPGDERLEKQLHMLPSAKISTIDAFCADILRANADRVGISPSFRVPDGAEAQLLGENILEGLLESIYEGELPDVATPAELDALTDCLAQARRQSELPVIIRRIYASTLDSLEGVGSIGALVSEFNPEKFTRVEDTGFGKYAMARLSELLSHYGKVFANIRCEIENIDAKKHAKIIDELLAAEDLIRRLSEKKSYEDIRTALSGYEFARGVSVSKKEPLPPVATVRKAFRGELLKMRDDFFLHTEEEWRIAYRGLYRQFDVLYRVVGEFDRLFRQEKIRRGICEFTDVERYTYECLWQNGEKTDVAKEQAKLYRAVYIDEYQDVNSLQNKIFEAISTDTNRFMVGDIKQSIYEFRSANPRIFADMKKSFPPLGGEGDYPAASIFMSDNFRCDEGVINFVNDVFDRLFYFLRDSIGYVEADRLTFSKVYDHPKPEYVYPEVCLVPAIAPTDPRSALVKDQADLVPEVVARKIKELLDEGYLDNGEKIEPRHIAIIMRNVKRKGNRYAKALGKLGIPSAMAENEKFFINSDVLLVLCLLNSIDNPHKDVYLAGLMCSPIWGFTLGEVAVIRKLYPAETLYDSLKKHAEEADDGGRVKKFLEKLAFYRLLSEGMPTDKLLMKLYHETGLLALSSNKKESKDNIMLLYEHARKFEVGSFKGLYNFISYINQLTGRESDFDKREAPGECDAVRIITAHGSKGLEYPIVFFAGGTASFNQNHNSGEPPRFEYEEDFGMGMFLRTDSSLALVRNSTKNIIKHYRHRKKIEEEARVLYVILTRARERLYVVGQVKSKVDEFEDETAASREYMSEYSVYNISTLLGMILEMKKLDTKLPTEFLKDPPFVYTDEAFNIDPSDVASLEDGEDEDTDGGEEMIPDVLDSGALESELKARFNFVYPTEYLTRLPGKLSVSRLYPAILDGSDEHAVKLHDGDANEDGTEEKRSYLPKFRSPDTANLSAERGIATHMLLQFCDLKRLTERGAREELKLLREGGFLSDKDAELVRVKEAEMFAHSRLISDMLAAKKLYREFRFNVKLPAEDFTTDEEQKKLFQGEHVLVQGVIDCLFEDAEGDYHLIDYKTDRLTPEEKENREMARAKLKEKHSLQLSYYAKAVELMFGKYPKTIEVYSLPLGDTLDVSR